MPNIYSLGEVAKHVGGKLYKNDCATQMIGGINTLLNATSSELGFFSDKKFAPHLESTGAGAVLVREDDIDMCPVPAIVCENPYLAYAHATSMFVKGLDGCGERIHGSASIDPAVAVPPSAFIGPNTVIESGVILGERVRIAAGSFIGRESIVADDSEIYPNVSIYHNVQIGARAIIHSGAVIGSDGFGFAPSPNGWVKIHQLGGVRIGTDVEIGANTTIDRGAIEHTIIGNNVKIDGAVFIAHNVKIGDGTAIAAQVAIAGSTTIGKNCMFAGKVGIAGHVEICDGVIALGNAMITKSIKESGSYSSGTPFQKSHLWRKNAVRFAQLDKIEARLKLLEKKDS